MQDIITKANIFALKKHQNQKDDSGQPYIDHLEKVYTLLTLITDDQAVLAAAWLHDTVEDTDTTEEELRSIFGDRITDLVMEVTHEGKKDETGFYYPRLHTQEGIMIKFADRLHNISRMEPWDDRRIEQYLKKSKFWKSSPHDDRQLDGIFVVLTEMALQNYGISEMIGIMKPLNLKEEEVSEALEKVASSNEWIDDPGHYCFKVWDAFQTMEEDYGRKN